MTTHTHLNSILPIQFLYESDSDIKFNTKTYTTIDGYQISINSILNNCKDIKINNYSCLFATNESYISNNIESIQPYIPLTIYTSLRSLGGYLMHNGNYTKTLNDDCMFEIHIQPDLTKCSIGFYDNTNFVNIFSNGFYNIQNDTIFLYSNNSSEVSSFKIDGVYNKLNINNTTAKYASVTGNVENVIEHKNNTIFTTQYNSINKDKLLCNFASFKNQKTYSNFNTYGAYWNSSNYKSLESLQTGSRQEKGNNLITTISEYYDYELKIVSGDNKFTTPKSLYPFNTININDTTFVKCGAFGSSTPVVADRLYTKTNNISDSTILLCTWLSSNADNSVWMDRYYDPRQISSNVALTSQSNTPGIYDEISTFCLSANTEYIYHRITEADIIEYTKQFKLVELNDMQFRDKNDIHRFTTTSYTLTGDLYCSTQPIALNNNTFTISFNCSMFDWQTAELLDLFTSQSNNFGLRIYKKNKFTPILYTHTHNKVYLYNTQFKLIDSFDIVENARNVYRTFDMNYFIALYDDIIRIYTVVGGLKAEISFGESINCISVDEKNLYVVCKNVVTKYDCVNFNCIVDSNSNPITATLPINNANFIYATNDGNCIYYDNTVNNIKKYAYVDGCGLFYIPTSSKWNTEHSYYGETLNNSQNFINLNPSTNNTKHQLSNADTVFLSMQTNKKIDDLTGFTISYDAIPCHDFCINGNNMYVVSLSTLYHSTLDRTIINKYTLPKHSLSQINDVQVFTTNEMKNNKYISRVFIMLIGDDNVIDVYEFINNQFVFITTTKDLILNEMHNIVGTASLPQFSNDFYFDVYFKVYNSINGDNTIICQYSKKMQPISAGEHAIVISVSPTGKCALYVDGIINTQIDNIINGDLANMSVNILQNKLIIGNTLLCNGINLASYLNTNDYLASDITISNIRMCANALSDEQIKLNAIYKRKIPNVVYTLPCGQRHEISNITSFKKQSVPGHKTSSFDILIKNLNLSPKHQQLLSNEIKLYLHDILPTPTTLDNVIYKNY